MINIAMRRTISAAFLLSLLALGGCSRLDSQRSFANGGTRIGNTVPQSTISGASPSVATASNASLINIGGFVDRNAVSKLSAKDRTEAASAQYYALQFGRPGAPRSWQGDTGATGKVSVGPYVRVNTLDCREFSHIVTVSGTSYDRSGTACREPDGRWDVAAS